MKRLAILCGCLCLTGCMSLPSSPVRVTSGNLDILYGTAHFGWELTVSNPFSTNNVPAVAPKPAPAPVSPPAPAPAPAPAPKPPKPKSVDVVTNPPPFIWKTGEL